jgi:hypothetical protein
MPKTTAQDEDNKLRVQVDRLKDALGFLAEKLQKDTQNHPRHGLYSGVMRILSGQDAVELDESAQQAAAKNEDATLAIADPASAAKGKTTQPALP